MGRLDFLETEVTYLVSVEIVITDIEFVKRFFINDSSTVFPVVHTEREGFKFASKSCVSTKSHIQNNVLNFNVRWNYKHFHKVDK